MAAKGIIVSMRTSVGVPSGCSWTCVAFLKRRKPFSLHQLTCTEIAFFDCCYVLEWRILICAYLAISPIFNVKY